MGCGLFQESPGQPIGTWSVTPLLATSADVAQALLEFAEQLESKPIHPEDVPAKAESEDELRRVKRRPGRRHLASFEHLPVTTQVYD